MSISQMVFSLLHLVPTLTLQGDHPEGVGIRTQAFDKFQRKAYNLSFLFCTLVGSNDN